MREGRHPRGTQRGEEGIPPFPGPANDLRPAMWVPREDEEKRVSIALSQIYDKMTIPYLVKIIQGAEIQQGVDHVTPAGKLSNQSIRKYRG